MLLCQDWKTSVDRSMSHLPHAAMSRLTWKTSVDRSMSRLPHANCLCEIFF
jgi:hypothetical protein